MGSTLNAGQRNMGIDKSRSTTTKGIIAMSEWLRDLLSSIPDAIASPITQWHQDEIRRDAMHLAHKERMKKMELESQERMVNKMLAVKYLETLQIAMETGNMDRELGEGLQRLPRLLE